MRLSTQLCRDNKGAGARRVSRLAFASVLLITPLRSVCWAQSEGTGTGPIDLKYEDGRILADYLPYSRRYSISGSLATTAGVADVVLVRVTEGKPPKPFDSSCWVRAPSAKSESTFKVVFDSSLVLERRYGYEFLFGQRVSDATVQAAATHAAASVRDQLKSGAVSGAAVTKALSDALVAAIPDADWITVKAEGRCELTKAPNLLVSSLIQRAIGELGQAETVLGSALARLADSRASLRGVPDASMEALRKDVIASLPNDRTIPLGRGLGRYSRKEATSDIDELIAARSSEDAQKLSVSASLRLHEYAKLSATALGISTANKQTLDDLLQAVDRARDAQAALAEANADHQRAIDVVTQKVQAPEIGLRFVPIARATEARTSWGAAADVRKLQIGTAVGGGAALLSPAHNSEWDGLMFVALRFYFAPVDRSLPQPWSSPLAHFAFDAGTLYRSTPSFRGQQLENASGDFSWIFGLSYDPPVTRWLAFSAGLMLFKQPSVNPANNGVHKKLHSAWYVGLSSDFDALNQLKDLLKL